MVLMTSSHCQRCGTPAAPDVRFCPACGQRLGVADPAGIDDPLLARVRAALLNEYDVAREIGRGGMAAVFLAEDLRLPRRVALKVMLPELAYSAVMPQRFVAEARTAAMLDHPNIVPVFHAGEQDGLRYFAMRFIDGCSLEQLQRAHGGLPVDLACHILAEVAAALAYAHAVGVVHRDVKPSNVMIDRRWARAIVTDFGIARIADGQRLTSTGLAIGTPEYMSPEQYSNDHLTGASDQYALGAVAYQLLAGRPPFMGTQAEVLVAHLREPPPALRTLRPEVPMAVETLVARMLAKEPDARWPSLAELATRFAEHVTSTPLTLREQLIALVPARASGDDPSPSPASPRTGIRQPEPPAGHTAPLASALDATPRLRDTGYTPKSVAPAASGRSPIAPSLDATGYTPRGVIPIRPTPTGPAPAMEPSDDEYPDPDEVTAEHEIAELSADGHASHPSALAQHRAWLRSDAGEAPPPRPRRSLLVGMGAGAVALLAVVLLTRDREPAPMAPLPVAAIPGPGAAPTTTTDAGEPVPGPAAGDSARRADSLAQALAAAQAAAQAERAALAARRLVVIEPTPRGARFDLPVNDSLRLRARVTDADRNAVADVRAVRWTSSAPQVVSVSPTGVVRAVAEAGEAVITARFDTDLARTLRIRAIPRPPRRAVATAEAPAPFVALSAEQGHRLVEELVDAARAGRVDALRGLFAAGAGSAPSPGRLLETLQKERELAISVATRELGGGIDHPTLRTGLAISWKRGGLGKLRGGRDGKTADVVARFERDGSRWRVQSLQLERAFEP